jgi:hypothetical protein
MSPSISHHDPSCKGVLTQRVFDMAGEMCRQCYRDSLLAQAELPHFGEAIDREVHLCNPTSHGCKSGLAGSKIPRI